MLGDLLSILESFLDWCIQELMTFGMNLLTAVFNTLGAAIGHLDPGMSDVTNGMTFFTSLSDWFPTQLFAVAVGIMATMTIIFIFMKAVDWVMDVIP